MLPTYNRITLRHGRRQEISISDCVVRVLTVATFELGTGHYILLRTEYVRLRTDEMEIRWKGSDRHLMHVLLQNLKGAQSMLTRFGPGQAVTCNDLDRL